jgi:hypothetical protein
VEVFEMAEDKNYYQILGVDPRIGQKDLKMHFRKIIKLYHPDLHAGAGFEDLYREILEAYDVLSNPSKRFDYDHTFNFGATSPLYGTSYDYSAALGKAPPKHSNGPRQTSSAPNTSGRGPAPEDPYELFKRIREAQKKVVNKYTVSDFLLREKVLGIVILSCFLISVLSTLTGVLLSSSNTAPPTLNNVGTIGVISGFLTLVAWSLFFLVRASMIRSKHKPAKTFFWLHAVPCALLYAYFMRVLCAAAPYSDSTVNFFFGSVIFEVIFAYSTVSLEISDKQKVRRSGR